MPTINIDPKWPHHPKTLKLICLAGAEAPFRLVALWCWASDYHPIDGVLAQYSPAEIESFAGWTGKKGKFYDALIESRYLDKGTNKLHDWEEHEGHLVKYMEKVKKMNLARLSKMSSQETHVESHQDVLQVPLQDDLQERLQDDLQESPEQSRAEQSSSEQNSSERRLEKTSDGSTAPPSTPSASALRAGKEERQVTPRSGARPDATENEPRAQGEVEYEVRLKLLTDYLMDHCKIGGNGNRTPGVVEKFREQAGRFEKLMRDRRPQIGFLSDPELVAAAKVAYAKVSTLDRLAAFTTVLYRSNEGAQVMNIAQTARNVVSRERQKV